MRLTTNITVFLKHNKKEHRKQILRRVSVSQTQYGLTFNFIYFFLKQLTSPFNPNLAVRDHGFILRRIMSNI